MHAKIVDIGTSKGIRIPKYLLDKYHIEKLVEIDDTGKGILIQPIKQPREGWLQAFKKVADSRNDALKDLKCKLS